MKTMKKIADNSKGEKSEADLLCGDAIMNYKTVQSLGYENLVVQKYEELLD